VLLCTETRHRSWGWMRFERFLPSFSGTFHPLAHCALYHPQSLRDLFLAPSRLFPFPDANAPLFSPISFLWGSHTLFSRPVTLTFSLSLTRSIRDKRLKEAGQDSSDYSDPLLSGSYAFELLLSTKRWIVLAASI
jgi:hypothetical protein